MASSEHTPVFKYNCQGCGAYLVIECRMISTAGGYWAARCPRCGAKRDVPGRVIGIDDRFPAPVNAG